MDTLIHCREQSASGLHTLGRESAGKLKPSTLHLFLTISTCISKKLFQCQETKMTTYVGRDKEQHQTQMKGIVMNKGVAEFLEKSKCKFHGSERRMSL